MSDPRRIVAVGQFGRTVKEAAKRLGLGIPRPIVEVAPGEPIPAEASVVLLDADLASAEFTGRPALLITVSQQGEPQGLGEAEIAFRRGPDAADAAAILLPALLDADAPLLPALPDAGDELPARAMTVEVLRLDMEADRPRRDCAHLLAARAAARLLDAGTRGDSPMPAAWTSLRRMLAGEEWPAADLADPLSAVTRAFSAGTLTPRELVAAARAALTGLVDSALPTVPLTALAADLDRALGSAVAAGGLAGGRALLSDALSALRSPDRPVPDMLDLGVDAAGRLAAALDDLERRIASWELVVTLTRRSALLSGLAEVSAAAQALVASRGAILPHGEPLLRLLESRWARLDEVEDRLAALAEDAGGAFATGVRARHYLASLPDGEQAAIDSLLRDVGAGPALLSGDLPAFLEGRSERFFAWVPDLPVDAQVADLTGKPLASVAGIPGSLSAGRAHDLASRLADRAVPLDQEGQVVLVRLSAAEGRVIPEPAGPTETPRHGLPVAPAPPLRPAPGEMAASPPADDTPLAIVVSWYPDEPAAAIAAAWDIAPVFRHEALFLDAAAAMRAAEEAWSRTSAGCTDDAPAAALDQAWIAAGLWEDRLGFWADSVAILARSEAAHTPPPGPAPSDLPGWYEAAVPEPVDPPGEAAGLASVGLATHLITHVKGYLAYAYSEDNGLIHAAYLAPADDPGALVGGLLEHREILPVLRRDARERLADARYHEAIRAYAHDLAAEVATRDWLRMPVSPHQRLLAEQGLAILETLPDGRNGAAAGHVAAPAADVPWDAGVVLPGLGRGAA